MWKSLLALSVAAMSLCADNSLVGRSQINSDKGTETSTLTIKALGNERYTFGYGDRAYDIAADGTSGRAVRKRCDRDRCDHGRRPHDCKRVPLVGFKAPLPW